MKFISPQVLAIFQQREMRMNLRALLRTLVILAVFVVVYSVIFHLLMLVEGQEHTWLTGIYWTLTVMSTLGFGDITFHTDLGRLFSLVVLLSGLVLLMIVLPFSFIRYFYAPWIEAQVHNKAPREVPPETEGHVIICGHGAVARVLIERLTVRGFQYVLLEPDSTKALSYLSDGMNVVLGEPDSVETWRAVRAERARLVVVNMADTTNSNITLALCDHAPDVPIAAFADDIDAVDVLELSGANHVIALKHRMGEHLAAHAIAGATRAHRVGNLGSLIIAEFSTQHTDLTGRKIRKSSLRKATGLNVVAIWERGHLQPAYADRVLGQDDVVVVVGTEDQLDVLDEDFLTAEPPSGPILLIGGGRVGQAAASALKAKGHTVHVVERDPALQEVLEGVADRVVIGNAANLDVMKDAGIEEAPSVLLTTRDDATNIFITVYSRRLNPGCRIVSRVTHDYNLDAIHRAGANFVLSESSLGAQLLVSVLLEGKLIVLGENVEIFGAKVPESLYDVSLAQSGIGAKTGLLVIGVERGGLTYGAPAATAPLTRGTELLLLGTQAQRAEFRRQFKS